MGCVANINNQKKDTEFHFIFDSLGNVQDVLFDIARQIASYFYHSDPQLCLQIVPVQQQNNNVDCEIYATSLAFGVEPD